MRDNFHSNGIFKKREPSCSGTEIPKLGVELKKQDFFIFVVVVVVVVVVLQKPKRRNRTCDVHTTLTSLLTLSENFTSTSFLPLKDGRTFLS